MNCSDVRDMIHPYIDGELDLATTLTLESHLRDCAGCASVRQNMAALHSSIRDGATYFRAPVSLERRIRASLPTSAARRPSSLRYALAAAAIVALVIGCWIATQKIGDRSDLRLASEITSAHVRSLMADHLWDVRSTDQHTVKPWFEGRLDFAPDVRDFPAASFFLEGGRLDYLDGRPVAALVYRHEKHFINLFIWPAPGQSDSRAAENTLQGYAMTHWVHAGMNYWAISDTAADSLRRFSTLVQNDAPATTAPASSRDSS